MLRHQTDSPCRPLLHLVLSVPQDSLLFGVPDRGPVTPSSAAGRLAPRERVSMFVSSTVARKGAAFLMAVSMVVPLLLTVAPVALAVDDTPQIAGTWTG